MAGKPVPPERHYPDQRVDMTPQDYKNLCGVRDELLLLAACAARRALREPELVVSRNTLAHCFEHLARRIGEVLNAIDEGTGRQGQWNTDIHLLRRR